MSAAKKTVKKTAKVSRAAKVQKPAPAAQKKAATTVKPGEPRSLNPLPLGVTGLRLLVELRAEKIMTRLHLKEKWEDVLGWDFNDLCAVVAGTMGERYMIKGEKAVLNKVKSFRNATVIKKIEALAKDPAVYFNKQGNLIPDIYERVLIVGLGTSGFPVQGDPNLVETGQLCDALAKFLKIDPSKVKDRPFERAKREVKKDYAEHMAKQDKRVKNLGPSPTGKILTKPTRSHTSLLREVFGQMALGGKILQQEKPNREREVRGGLAKAGIKMPVRRNTSS